MKVWVLLMLLLLLEEIDDSSIEVSILLESIVVKVEREPGEIEPKRYQR